ncbi:MAG: HupE/UreJ family protein [Alphaproteobacteria bacterium]
MSLPRTLAAFALTLLLPASAFAHTGAGDVGGLAHGFMHPLGGLDHVLAMVAVGLFAAHLGGRALWAVPAAFVVMMAAGGALGMAGVGLPAVETAIALSVLVLGAAVALRAAPTTAVAMGLVGFFAIFHGFAHGAELPDGVSGLAYAAGFAAATALLHAAGIALGLAVGRFGGAIAPIAARATGAVIAVAGVGMLAGLV